jgi:hypothetical protein
MKTSLLDSAVISEVFQGKRRFEKENESRLENDSAAPHKRSILRHYLNLKSICLQTTGRPEICGNGNQQSV